MNICTRLSAGLIAAVELAYPSLCKSIIIGLGGTLYAPRVEGAKVAFKIQDGRAREREEEKDNSYSDILLTSGTSGTFGLTGGGISGSIPFDRE